VDLVPRARDERGASDWAIREMDLEHLVDREVGERVMMMMMMVMMMMMMMVVVAKGGIDLGGGGGGGGKGLR
jgi:hypothetical protein